MKVLETARDLPAQAGEQLRETFENVRDAGRDVVHRTRREVVRRPFTSILTALTVGIALGSLVGLLRKR